MRNELPCRYLRTILMIGLGLLGLSLTACLNLPSNVTPNASNPIREVAILPFVNNTNDVAGPDYVRTKLAEELVRHAYAVKPLGETDVLLRDQMGITIGTQLDMATPQQFGEALGVDGVMYASLEDFSHNVYGVTNNKTVRIRAKLVECKSGAVIWSDGIGVKNTSGVAGGFSNEGSGNGDDLPPLFGTPINTRWERQAGVNTGLSGGGLLVGAVAGLTEKIATKAASAPMFFETTTAVRGILQGIPAGSYSGSTP